MLILNFSHPLTTAQLAVIALGMLLFGAMGLANDGTGGCGGG